MIMLDTHALVWWREKSPRLSQHAKSAIARVDNRIAVASIQLPAGLPKDPADRIIVATAIQLSIPIVTADHKMRAYPHVQTIW